MWMTHPAWPSNSWQIYSSDYDTSAAYYGAKKAAEPLHVQLNLPDNELVVVNTHADSGGRTARRGARLDARQPAGVQPHRPARCGGQCDHRAGAGTAGRAVPRSIQCCSSRCGWSDSAGTTLAENFYWRGRDPAAYRSLGDLPAVPLMAVMAPASPENGEDLGVVTLTNRSPTPALNIKLTLIDSRGARILPAFYSDNYIALMPGESRAVTIPVSRHARLRARRRDPGMERRTAAGRCRCSTLTGAAPMRHAAIYT